MAVPPKKSFVALLNALLGPPARSKTIEAREAERKTKEAERKTREEERTKEAKRRAKEEEEPSQLFERIERLILMDITDDKIIEELEEKEFDKACKKLKFWKNSAYMIGIVLERKNALQILQVLRPDHKILEAHCPAIRRQHIISCCTRGDIGALEFINTTFKMKILHPEISHSPINHERGILINAVGDDNDALVHFLLSEFRKRSGISLAYFNKMLQSQDPLDEDNNILHFAVYFRARKVLTLLKDKFRSNICWNVQNREGWTPLGIAASNEDLETLMLLLSVQNINVNVAGWGGDTVLQMSVAEDLYKVIAVLMKFGKCTFHENETDSQAMTISDHITRNQKLRSLLNTGTEKSTSKRRKIC